MELYYDCGCMKIGIFPFIFWARREQVEPIIYAFFLLAGLFHFGVNVHRIFQGLIKRGKRKKRVRYLESGMKHSYIWKPSLNIM